MCQTDAEKSDKEHRKDRVVIDWPESRMTFEQKRACGDEQQTEQQLPCGVRQRLDRQFGPFDIDSCNSPAERASERIKDERLNAIGEQWPQQDRYAKNAQPEGEPADCIQSFAENKMAQHSRPDRHRIRDNDGARCRTAELRKA